SRMIKIYKYNILVALLLIPWFLATAADERGLGRIPPGEKRVALVIGNNDYQHVEKLKNAVADAQAMKRELSALGFEVVFRQDASRKEMNKAITTFTNKLSPDAVGLVFYAGHGVQIRSANYLVPVDVEAQEESDLMNEAIDVARILEQMSETKAKFSLAVLDACRDNPFKGSGSRAIGGTRGLAAPSGNASGIMVIYSAGANQQALDRLNAADKHPNGLFTREFLKAIKEPGVNVKAAVENVKQTVIAQAKSVGHQQTPAIYDQSTGSFFFTLPPDSKVTLSVEPSGGSGQTDRETVYWQSAQGDPVMCQKYLQKYPKGEYVDLAQRCVEKGKPSTVVAGGMPDDEKSQMKLDPMDREMVSGKPVKLRASADAKGKLVRDMKEGEKAHVLGRTPDGKWYRVEVKVGKETKEGFVIAEDLMDETAWEKRKREDEQKAQEEQKRKKEDREAAQIEMARHFEDPVTGMEFVLVPGGTFQMGCDSWTSDCDDDEKPVHQVTLSGFWLGKTEITQGQWQAVMGSNPSKFSSCGDQCPVEKVSWEDVQTFIKKLNARGDGKFRLPTEAEWEYACRSGGKEENYSGGKGVDQVAWYDGNSGHKTHPVGTRSANGLGLFDMSGNVYEWVQDWNTDYSSAAQTNPIYDSSGSYRVYRGGSWVYGASNTRCANRYSYTPDGRFHILGARLARRL
ncbi:MAG: SUMF1/EgtB/PvdO family nonheme iron enzyme, partial [Magnetococcales bacterium]|nr:SUMF1/EgtB/PvdO family nonheme iron enzyme [Magnetococcales bacterium]